MSDNAQRTNIFTKAIIEPFELHHAEYEKWFEKNTSAYQSELAALRWFVPMQGRGIEIGVGSGRFASPLGIDIGIDPSPKMGRMARSRGLEVLDAIAEALPFRNGSFAFALMVTTVCFLRDVEAALKEAYRVLKPSGSVIIGFIDKDGPLGISYRDRKNESAFYSLATFYSVSDMVARLEKAGFKHFSLVQTLFHSLTELTDIEPVRAGYGQGAFVVIRARK
ncbi:MAG: class I SAM-dependent methyltransferase [Dehalococcoidia bacterium]